MKRKQATSAQIRKVDRLRAGETGHPMTVAQACEAVGILQSIYYRHKQNELRFPALHHDWDMLTETFKPILPVLVQEQLPPGKLDELRYAVGGEFRSVYSKPASVRTARQCAPGLKSFAGQLSKLIRIHGGLDPDLREHARTAARIAAAHDDFELDEVMDLLEPVASGFPQALQELSNTEGVVPRTMGGRKFDPRPRQIAAQLAAFFAMIVGGEPTAWRNPDETPSGAFNAFALGAFKHFVGSDVSDDHSVCEAPSFAAWRIDHSDGAAGREDTLD